MTQYEKLLAALSRAGRRGMTMRQMIEASNSTCPWKRIGEHATYGRLFEYGKREVWLRREWRLVDGKRLRFVVMEKL